MAKVKCFSLILTSHTEVSDTISAKREEADYDSNKI